MPLINAPNTIHALTSYKAILPPPRLVITTIDGRGGMSGLKSGQRVIGSSNVEHCIGRSALGRVLNGDKQSFVVGREARAARFSAERHTIEVPRCAA